MFKHLLAVIVGICALSTSAVCAYTPDAPGENAVERALNKANQAAGESRARMETQQRETVRQYEGGGSSNLCGSSDSLADRHCRQQASDSGVANIPGCGSSWDAVKFCSRLAQDSEVIQGGGAERVEIDSCNHGICFGYALLKNGRTIQKSIAIQRMGSYDHPPVL